MNKNHTKGPWFVQQRARQVIVSALSDLGLDVPLAIMVGESEEDVMADAVMLSLAPDMFKMLEHVAVNTEHSWACLLDLPAELDLAGSNKLIRGECIRCKIEKITAMAATKPPTEE